MRAYSSNAIECIGRRHMAYELLSVYVCVRAYRPACVHRIKWRNQKLRIDSHAIGENYAETIRITCGGTLSLSTTSIQYLIVFLIFFSPFEFSSVNRNSLWPDRSIRKLCENLDFSIRFGRFPSYKKKKTFCSLWIFFSSLWFHFSVEFVVKLLMWFGVAVNVSCERMSMNPIWARTRSNRRCGIAK